jgi:hypothetical protein
MGNCKICGQPKDVFMQNKFVCIHCDELLFDMEIELDGPAPKQLAPAPAPATAKPAKVLRLVEKKPAAKKEEPKKETALDVFEEDDQDQKTKKVA